MKTALVLAPQWCTSFPTYALALLSARLKESGHEAAIFDVNREMFSLNRASRDRNFAPQVAALNNWSDSHHVETRVIPAYRDYLDSTVERILSGGSRVVGFSVFFSNAVMSLYLARRLKERDPDVCVVFGGPSCLSFEHCRGFLAHDAVDVVVFGEADRSFPELVTAYEKSGRLRAAPGVLLRESPSSWIERQDPIEDLDGLPFADYEGHHLELYGGIKTIHTCRGCVRRCVFCSDWREMSYRQMSGDRIYREIVHQLGKEPRTRLFLFGDSLINSSMKSLSIFCGRMIGDSVTAKWGGLAIVRPDLNPSALAQMRLAGCSWMTFGIESGSKAVLGDIGKHVDRELNARVLKDAAHAGIRTQVTWLVGFPSETDAAFDESIEYLRANAGGIGSLFPNLFSVRDMKDDADRFGFDCGHDLYWRSRDGRNTFPVRVERLRRIVKDAGSFGIDAKYDGYFDAANIDACCEALLEEFRRWESRRSA